MRATRRTQGSDVPSLCALVLTASLLCLIPTAGSGQVAHSGPVAEVTGVANILHMIADMNRSMAFYGGILGFRVNRAPRGPANDPNAYIKMLPNLPTMYLVAENAQYRSVEMFLATPTSRLELEDFKDLGTKPIRPRLIDPGATVLMLWVKDLDDVVKRVTQAGADVVSAGKKPVNLKAEGGSERVLFVKDPDGFLIEFIQPNPLPASAASAGQNVFAAGLGVSVNDIDYTSDFYKSELGFQVQEAPDFVTDQPFLQAAGLTKGLKIRRASTTIPGTSFPMEFMEFKGLERKAVFSAVHDVGATMLRINIKDMSNLVQNLQGAGIPINSSIGRPETVNSQLVIRGPDNLFLQLTPPPRPRS
jgi:catechol 2,3-dioxygenase-like lactoylglutathione lyase family enzyme